MSDLKYGDIEVGKQFVHRGCVFTKGKAGRAAVDGSKSRHAQVFKDEDKVYPVKAKAEAPKDEVATQPPAVDEPATEEEAEDNTGE